MDIATLIDERAIHRTLCRLAEAMDNCAWDELDEIFTPDATGDFGDGPMDRAGIAASFRRYLDACGPTQHLLGNLVVEIDGDRAESKCYVRDMHLGQGDKADLTFSSPGQYLDSWRRTPDGWRIAHRRKRNLMHIGSMAVFDGG